MKNTRPIAISLSPNTQKDDVFLAFKTLLSPWKWKKGDSELEVERWFAKQFRFCEAVSFNSGRSALYALLKSIGIGKGDEVLIQGFTCVAVPNAVIWCKASSKYVDIDETLNIDPVDLEKKISDKTKAVIVQHTFGIPAQIDKIKKITKKHGLFLIEDCAHSLGAVYKNKKIGTFGDGAVFSFGRDKIVSSVFGGLAGVSNQHREVGSRLRSLNNKLSYPSCYFIMQQLLHPLVFALVIPLYSMVLGKVILVFFQKTTLLSKAIFKDEYVSDKPKFFPAKYPPSLAKLLLFQIEKLSSYNKKRQYFASLYQDALSNTPGISLPKGKRGSVYLRFNILTDRAEEIISYAKKQRVILGNWYRNVIDPKGVDLEKVGYQRSSLKKAEKKALLSVNLPTCPTLSEKNVEKVIKIVKSFT